MDFGITGKWALVCGASKGLGFACAEALAREGANVVIVARGEPALTAAAERLRTLAPDVQVVAVPADITTPEGRTKVFDTQGAPGRDYDILVTNAGGPPPGDFRDWDDEVWHAALRANMLTPIALIRDIVDGMAARGFGRVINITSIAVKAPIDVLGLSNGARSGLTGFVAGLARSGLAAQGVTINNLLPGFFATDRLLSTFDAEAQRRNLGADQVADARTQSIPARRFGNPQEFGQVCAFMCSQQAAYMNGQNVLLDGGAYGGTF
ncbi:MAG: SDR family oxidoreductase [Gemmobacter sp.]|nr:SDR family oxidoreductase [Gemmobacter sp.]